MSSPFSPISQVPEEVLHSILRHVRDTSPHSTFLACLRCCKRWRNSGMPLECEAIVVTSANLSIFLNQFSPAHYVHIRSLTVSVRLSQRGYKDRKQAAFHVLLQSLAVAINKMTMLSTFSFAVSRPASPTLDCKLPSGILAALVQSLPPRCVDLELDTRGHDTLSPRSVHLCNHLRELLPRLRTFRIRLAYLCPLIFAASFNTLEDLSSLTPVVAPFLQVAVVNCFIAPEKFQGSARTCRTGSFWKARPEAHDLLAACLREFVGRESTYPALERLCVKCEAPDLGYVGCVIQLRRNNLLNTMDVMKYDRLNRLDGWKAVTENLTKGIQCHPVWFLLYYHLHGAERNSRCFNTRTWLSSITFIDYLFETSVYCI